MNKNKEFLINTIIIFLGKLSTRFIVFLLLPLYTALLDPAELGTADLVTTYITLLIPVFTLELDMGVFRFLIDAKNDRKEQGTILKTAYAMYAMLSVVFTAVFFIVNAVFPLPYKWYILGSVLIGFFCSLFQQVARGYNDNLGYSISCFLAGVTTAVSNYFLIKHVGMRGEAILLSTILGNAVCILYLFFHLKMYRNQEGHYDKDCRDRLLKYSIPLIPNVVSWWVINGADRTVVTVYLGALMNGIYAVVVKFPSAVAGLFYTYQISWVQTAARHIDDEDAESFFNEMFDLTARVFGAICIAVIACMPFLFPLFVKGENYNDAYRYIPWTMYGIYLYTISTMYNGIYTAKKDTRIVARTSIIGAAVNLLMDLPLVPLCGLYATAISTISAYAYMLIARDRDIKRYMNVSYDWKTVGLISAVYVLVAVLYSMPGNLRYAGTVIGLVSAIFINRKTAGKILRAIKQKITKGK